MDKELLFVPRLPEEEIEIPGLGTLRIRALSRLEALHVQDANDTAERDRRILAQGILDPMLMIEGMRHEFGDKPCAKCADAGRWQAAAPAGEAEPASVRISIMSGMMEESPKAAFKSDGSGSESGVRVLPSVETGDERGQAASGDLQ